MTYNFKIDKGIFAVGTFSSTTDLVTKELTSMGLTVINQQLGWVTTEGSLRDAYKVMLWSRVGDRVVWIIKRGDAGQLDKFRGLVREIHWQSYLYISSKIRIDVSGKVNWLKNSRFAGQILMDAIRDQAELANQPRPEYESHNPDIRIALRFSRGRVDVGLYLNKTPLNQRGYRKYGGRAPLKETLAQVMIQRLQIADSKKFIIVDPFCGVGTLLIEAIMCINQIAPQRSRPVEQLCSWRGLEIVSWDKLVGEARKYEKDTGVQCIGFDIDQGTVDCCQRNIELAGLQDSIRVEVAPLNSFGVDRFKGDETGWILTNPPYGTRLESKSELEMSYRALGKIARKLRGWSFGVITSEIDLAQAIPLRPQKRWKFQAGKMKLIISKYLIQPNDESNDFRTKPLSAPDEIIPLLNRIGKNLTIRKKLINQLALDCYRIYDADIPEFNVIIDRYNDYLHIQEYRPPKTINQQKVTYRRQMIGQWVPKFLGIPIKQTIYKERFRQVGNLQYQKRSSPLVVDVVESGMVFEVNLTTYTDVGLFMDHRPLRRRLLKESKGKRVLNLFCYTGTLSVACALGMAKQVDSVDISKSYLAWAERNFVKNKLNPKHYRFFRKNILEWIKKDATQLFDIILLDPPTFSNTKSCPDTLDIQRDHSILIDQCMRHLDPNGTLYFSSNQRGFKMDSEVGNRYRVTDITWESLDLDFKRSKSHVLFQIDSIDVPSKGSMTRL